MNSLDTRLVRSLAISAQMLAPADRIAGVFSVLVVGIRSETKGEKLLGNATEGMPPSVVVGIATGPVLGARAIELHGETNGIDL